jgi:hypothetical protein
VKIFSKGKEVKKERAFDVDSRMGSSQTIQRKGGLARASPSSF